MSLDLLPTDNSLEETKVSGNKLPMDQAPEIETSTNQANIENGDAPAKFPYEILTTKNDDSGGHVEILKDARKSSAGTLIANQTVLEPIESSSP